MGGRAGAGDKAARWKFWQRKGQNQDAADELQGSRYAAASADGLVIATVPNSREDRSWQDHRGPVCVCICRDRNHNERPPRVEVNDTDLGERLFQGPSSSARSTRDLDTIFARMVLQSVSPPSPTFVHCASWTMTVVKGASCLAGQPQRTSSKESWLAEPGARANR